MDKINIENQPVVNVINYKTAFGCRILMQQALTLFCFFCFTRVMQTNRALESACDFVLNLFYRSVAVSALSNRNDLSV